MTSGVDRDSSGVFFQMAMAGATTDPEVVAWLEHGFRSWWNGGGRLSLTDALGLPANPEVLARTQRDYWLCRAARDLPEPRATHLAEAIRRNAHRVESWARSDGPPESATEAMLALYFAIRSGAKIPSSAKQLNRIIAWDMVCQSVSAPACDDGSNHTEKRCDEKNYR